MLFILLCTIYYLYIIYIIYILFLIGIFYFLYTMNDFLLMYYVLYVFYVCTMYYKLLYTYPNHLSLLILNPHTPPPHLQKPPNPKNPGESVPQMKESLTATAAETAETDIGESAGATPTLGETADKAGAGLVRLDMNGTHRVNVLFSGSSIVTVDGAVDAEAVKNAEGE
jgi:hypothetical protein